MRGFAHRAASLSLVAVIGTLSLAGAAIAATGAGGTNLNGTFNVTEVLTNKGNIIGKTTNTFHYVWTISPTCGVGACPAVVVGPGGARIHLVPNGTGYTGSGQTTGNCVTVSSPHYLLAS